MRLPNCIFATIATILTSHARADLITIPGTGQFNSSLGVLNSVTVLIDPPAISASFVGNHIYPVDPGPFAVPYGDGTVIDFVPIATINSGVHSHFVDTPTFTWNGLLLDFPSVNSSVNGNHAHVVDFAPAVVVNGSLDLSPAVTSNSGSHSHSIDIPSFSQSFTGSSLSPFLTGIPNSEVNAPSFGTALNGSHLHTLGGIPYNALVNGSPMQVFLPAQGSSVGPHAHAVAFPQFSVLSTTFDYTPVAIPEPSLFIPFTLAALTIACLHRLGTKASGR